MYILCDLKMMILEIYVTYIFNLNIHMLQTTLNPN